MSKTVEEALATAEEAGYRIDALLGEAAVTDAGEESVSSAESETSEAEPSQSEKPEPQEPEIESPAATAASPVEPA
jgi:hypothetical protein